MRDTWLRFAVALHKSCETTIILGGSMSYQFRVVGVCNNNDKQLRKLIPSLFLSMLVAVAVTACGGGGGGGPATSNTIISGTIPTTDNESVPTVTGLSQANAESAITAGGLVVGMISRAFSTSVPAGSVIAQSPAAGTSVVLKTAVNLVISSTFTSRRDP